MHERFTRREFIKTAGFLAFGMPAFTFLAGSKYSAPFTDGDADLCVKKFAVAVDNKLTEKTIGEIVASIGNSFVGTGYEAGVLDTADTERLIVHLDGLDCVTLCENSLALARCIRLGTMTFEAFCKQLQLIRYRGGTIDGYPSRLHYFSDWIFDNGKKRVVQNVTAAVGGPSVVAKSLQVDFMTSHRPSYRQLANDAFFDSIRRQEQLISARTFVYIPKAAVLSISQNIRHGDILAMTTTMPGMDVSHTGIAYRTGDGAVHLLHAPVPGTKVRITDLPLSDYLAGNSKQTGIIVARPLEPQ